MTHLCMLTHTIKYIGNSCFSIYITPFGTWTENRIYFIMLTLFRMTSGIPQIAWGGGGSQCCMYKMPFLDDEMCTVQKVGGQDSKGQRVL